MKDRKAYVYPEVELWINESDVVTASDEGVPYDDVGTWKEDTWFNGTAEE